MQYNILSHIKRFEAYETIGGLFDRTVNGAMELSVTERIWELILPIVAVIAELFSADEEEIIRMISSAPLSGKQTHSGSFDDKNASVHQLLSDKFPN